MLPNSFLILLCTLWCLPGHELNTRVYNGQPATRGQFPWQVALYIPKNDRMGFCGGTLISDLWILTAAHCLLEYRIRVLLGTLKSTGDDADQIELHAREWIRSDLYYPYENDIGLVKLPEALVFNDYIQPLALASDDLEGLNVPVSVSGWGGTSEADARSEDLTFTNLFTTNTSCSFAAGIICAVPDPSSQAQNICGGDSGGALVVNATTNPVQVGIVSFYYTCQRGYSAGFTSVAYQREWIRSNSGV